MGVSNIFTCIIEFDNIFLEYINNKLIPYSIDVIIINKE